MTRALVLVFSLLSLWSSPASAEEAKSEPMTEEQWLKTLRGSGSYQTGMNNVRRLIDAAYDDGAIAGARHWGDMREYYIGLARQEGCRRGKPYAEGPVACFRRQAGTGRVSDVDPG